MTDYVSASVGERLIAFWKTQGSVDLRPPATESTIRRFEEKYGVVLPADVRDYFLHVDGFRQLAGGDQDANGFNFWPLGRVKPVSKDYDASQIRFPGCENHFLFVDYMVWCHAYTMELSKADMESPVFLVGTVSGRPNKIAESFNEFVDLYVADDPKLYQID